MIDYPNVVFNTSSGILPITICKYAPFGIQLLAIRLPISSLVGSDITDGLISIICPSPDVCGICLLIKPYCVMLITLLMLKYIMNNIQVELLYQYQMNKCVFK